MSFSADVLEIDTGGEIDRISNSIRRFVADLLKRRGCVVGVSGGIDSSVCLALCARAVGSEHTLAVLMPERESSPDSLRLGQALATQLGTRFIVEDITPTLESSGCYARQLEAIRMVFPEYGPGWKNKITMPSILDHDRLNLSRLTVQLPGGEFRSERMPLTAYLQLVAATNFKQRTRKMLEYYHADKLNYAVCGTPNRLEYDQGFFVKGGDGAADFKPIAHLYKSQVYALGRALGLPETITGRTPTTDTFSLPQTQEEFYFAIPYQQMDLCLYAHNHEVPADEVAGSLGLTKEQVERIYKDIETKRRTTSYLQMPPLLVDRVTEIHDRIKDLAEGEAD